MGESSPNNAVGGNASQADIFRGRALIMNALLSLLRNAVGKGIYDYDHHAVDAKVANRIKKAAMPTRLDSAVEHIMCIMEGEGPVNHLTFGGIVDVRVNKRRPVSLSARSNPLKPSSPT